MVPGMEKQNEIWNVVPDFLFSLEKAPQGGGKFSFEKRSYYLEHSSLRNTSRRP